ncbi:hypothetical protein MMC13_002290 [Lambiella insularis]|nr:hypothetical protein [Lambiella insularis]
MPSFKNVLLAAAAICATAVDGHMIMKTPTPYGKSSLNNSPLAPDGSDFPCKQRSGVYDAEGASNTMPIGVNQTLSFTGSAVHGGGSCQVSLTTDAHPTVNSKWQVIHSIQGGCPVSAAGNLPEDPNGSGASTFQFSVPEGIAPGQYTLAWTWFNRIGNREMYMNCAPVTVTGGSSKRDAPKSLAKRTDFPPMFVANACSNKCTTSNPTGNSGENYDLQFPNPGQSVQYAGSNPFFSSLCSCGQDAAVAGNTSSSPASAPAPAPASPAASPAAASSMVASATGGAGGIASAIASAFPSSFTVVASPIPSSAASSVPAVAPPAASPTGSASTGTTPSAGALTGPCTPEGQANCIGGNSFQQCASGAWSVVQPVAPGTFCTPGQSASLTITRRSIRFGAEHLNRHRVRGGY